MSNILTDLPNKFKLADISVKHNLLCSIFPNKIVYDEKKYQTHRGNKVILLLIRFNKDFRKHYNKKPLIQVVCLAALP